MSNSELISHYTSIEGFKGIIQSGKIWATNVMFLNDNKEYFHAFEALNLEIEKLKGELNSISNEDDFFFSAFKQCMDYMDLIGAEQHYVTSFSENLDQLSQWRAYGSIGIVFHKAALEESFFKNEGLLCDIAPCRYDSSVLETEIHGRIRGLYNDYLKALKPEGKEKIFDLVADLQAYIYRMAAFYKDSGFHEECEFRLSCASTGKEEVNFRSNGSCLIPYVEVSYDPSAIDSVFIGPCVDPERMERSIKLFLNQKFPKKQPKIYRSKSPFRNW